VTGAVRYLKADAAKGPRRHLARPLARDRAGNLVVQTSTPGRRALGNARHCDSKRSSNLPDAQKAWLRWAGMAVTIDVDAGHDLWASTPSGAVRFDPVAEKFTEFKSGILEKNAESSGATYGAPEGRDGNGLVGADGDGYRLQVATWPPARRSKIKMPDVKVDRMFGADRAFYESVSDLGFNAPLPWSQGPRRMGTDKNADLLWVGNS